MIKILQKFLGDKKTRDLKELNPYVAKVNEAYKEISKLTNDGLREKTAEFKKRIADNIASEEAEIASIKEQIETNPELDINEKESQYELIDRLEKQSYDKTQQLLNEMLPEAFSVMKETAKRFTENEVVEVTANDFDRHLASTMDNVNIKGDKAYYDNQWMAGGNLITWDMVHYDVQLIGGIVLHQGKIAEMATGEGKTLVATLTDLPQRTTWQGCSSCYSKRLPGQT